MAGQLGLQLHVRFGVAAGSEPSLRVASLLLCCAHTRYWDGTFNRGRFAAVHVPRRAASQASNSRSHKDFY